MTESAYKPPAIDIDMLTMALQAGDLETGWWLDTHNGNVIPAPEPDGDAVEQKLLKEKERSPDRYIDIKPIEDEIHIELMESFVATLEQVELSESLYASLSRQQPIWHFKKALASVPDCEDNWYAFKEQFYALQARQWLRDRGLEHKEYQADIKINKEDQAEPQYNSTMPVLMQLTISDRLQQRRYAISFHAGQIMLTVFSQEENQAEQVMAEVQLNEHQLSGVNHIIETYRVYIEPLSAENNLNATLEFSNALSSGTINGEVQNGNVFQSLLTMLDMLLGVPALKA